MNAKVVVLCFIFYGLFGLKINAQENLVWIASELKLDEEQKLIPSDFPFFDDHQDKVFYSLHAKEIRKSYPQVSHVQLEIKKKGANQDQYKPFVAKRFPEKLWLQDYPIDSLSFDNQLFSGNFDLLFLFQDKEQKTWKKVVIPIQVFRKNSVKKNTEFVTTTLNKDSNQHVETSFVKQYSLKQLKTNIAALAPIAKGGDFSVVKDIQTNNDLGLLQTFFFNFWKNHEPEDPEKGWKAYAAKLNTVAKLYGNGQQKGYETDRGRIYLTYGQPDKVERCLQEKNARPYEIWFYYAANGRNNVKFLFVQPGMMSNQYLLLHSTESDEMVNPSWRAGIFLTNPNNDKENLQNHRVFQYFQ